MTQREVRLAELKKRIAALDDERTAIAAEIATLEQVPIPEMLLPDVASLERGDRIRPSLANGVRSGEKP